MNVEVFQLLRGKVFLNVHLVFCRQNDVGNAGTLGGQHFFFNPTNGQHVTAECDLPGHRRERLNAAPGQ